MNRIDLTRRINHPRDEVFSVVADVESYPAFVPGFLDARVIRREEEYMVVFQRVGFSFMTVTFTSHAQFEAPRRIEIRSTDWPFELLQQEWHFDALDERQTQVRFSAEYVLLSKRLNRLMDMLYKPMMWRTISAFERRLDEAARTCSIR